MSRREKVRRPAAWLTAVASTLLLAATPASAVAAGGFGPLSGSSGCLVAPGMGSAGKGTAGCGEGKGLVGPNAVAVSPDGANVYVASGIASGTVASSFGSLAILKRDPATGAITQAGCLSSDGTDGRDGASGACAATPSLLGADGVAVSPDGLAVFVTSNASGSVVAFARDPANGSLTRLGCFQARPPGGSPCPPANVFFSSSALVASADNKALYVAAPTQGSISTLMTGLITPPASGGAAGAGGSASTVASIFGVLPPTEFFANPCIAVNGFDGSCAVGIATQGLDALALSPDGRQLYGTAPGSSAVDVFTHDAAGALTESSCLKVEPPGGLCRAGKLMKSPTQLAVSPDGRNVYASDTSPGGRKGGRVSPRPVERRPLGGELRRLPAVERHEENEEEEEGPREPAPSGPCSGAAGLDSVSVVAVSGDGSAVYAIGSGSAAIFSRDASTGKLSETSCAVNEDSRCTSLPPLEGVAGAAVSPDGREVYVAAARSDAVMVFGLGAAVATGRTSATRAGTARVRVECPRGLRRSCTGHVELTRVLAGRATHGTPASHPADRQPAAPPASRSGRDTSRRSRCDCRALRATCWRPAAGCG